MGAIFSRRSSGSPSSPNPNATITEHDRAVLNLKNQRDRLQKYERQLEALTAKEIEAAKTLLQQGDKKRALMCMKRKKLRERDLANITGLLDNVHHTISTLEFAKVQVDVVSSLKDGSEALKRLNDLMNIDKVDLIMADTAEAIAYQNEIKEMLATDLADHDDAEFEDELNNLMAGESHQLPTDTQTDLPATSIEELPVLPPVPTHDPRTTLPAIDDTASSSDEKDDQTEADSARPAKTPSASKRQQVAA